MASNVKNKKQIVRSNGFFSRWQFVSQGNTPAAHLFYIQLALEGGCRWIQLRLKNQTRGQILEAGHITRHLCDRYQATFILNDHLHLALDVGSDGVHLGLKDPSIQVARQTLGDAAIIGGTANTATDVRMRVVQGVDYVGLGPYRYTTTKLGLSPVLGLMGYKKVLQDISINSPVAASNSNCLDLPPIYAIGGILEHDVPAIFKTGVKGVAVSGYLSRQVDLRAAEIASNVKLSCSTVTEFYNHWKEKNSFESKKVLDSIRAFNQMVNG